MFTFEPSVAVAVANVNVRFHRIQFEFQYVLAEDCTSSFVYDTCNDCSAQSLANREHVIAALGFPGRHCDVCMPGACTWPALPTCRCIIAFGAQDKPSHAESHTKVCQSRANVANHISHEAQPEINTFPAGSS